MNGHGWAEVERELQLLVSKALWHICSANSAHKQCREPHGCACIACPRLRVACVRGMGNPWSMAFDISCIHWCTLHATIIAATFTPETMHVYDIGFRGGDCYVCVFRLSTLQIIVTVLQNLRKSNKPKARLARAPFNPIMPTQTTRAANKPHELSIRCQQSKAVPCPTARTFRAGT
jgi:hypothetical protein